MARSGGTTSASREGPPRHFGAQFSSSAPTASNNSGIGTVQVLSITGNTALAAMPGTVFVPAGTAGLREDSVVLAHQISTVDRSDLESPPGGVDHIGSLIGAVGAAMRLVLDV